MHCFLLSQKFWGSSTISGVKLNKPQFEKLLESARPRNTIVVLKLERLGRNTVQLIELKESLKQKGIHLKSLREAIDTNTD